MIIERVKKLYYWGKFIYKLRMKDGIEQLKQVDYKTCQKCILRKENLKN